MRPNITLITAAGPALHPVELAPDAPLFIGRSSGSTLQLRHAKVSRSHAELRPIAGKWMLKDNNSKHGTTLNTRDVDPLRPVEVKPGDSIGIGPWQFTVTQEQAESTAVVTEVPTPSYARRITPSEIKAHNPTFHSFAALVAKLSRLPSRSVQQQLEDAQEVLDAAFHTTAIHIIRPADVVEVPERVPQVPIELIHATAAQGIHIARNPAAKAKEPTICTAPISSDGTLLGIIIAVSESDALEIDPLYILAAAEIISSSHAKQRAFERDAKREATVSARQRLVSALQAKHPKDRQLNNSVLVRLHEVRRSAGAIDIPIALAHPDFSSTLMLASVSGNAEGLAIVPSILTALLEYESQSVDFIERFASALNQSLAIASTHPPIIDLAAMYFPPPERSDQQLKLLIAGDMPVVRCRPGKPPAALTTLSQPPIGIDPETRHKFIPIDKQSGDRFVMTSAAISSQTGEQPRHPIDRLIADLEGSPTINDDHARISDMMKKGTAPKGDITTLCITIPTDASTI